MKYEVYTSGDRGSNIRHAITGKYYSYKVGSKDEDLFFSIILATGECKSKNGSSILFYESPNEYMKHQNIELSLERIQRWKNKFNKRQSEINNKKHLKTQSIII